MMEIADRFSEMMIRYNHLTNDHGSGAAELYLGEALSVQGRYEESDIQAYQAAFLSEQASNSTVSYGASLLLGINAIYHHLYDFGNIPVFFAYGKKYVEREIGENGEVIERRYVDLRAVTDERICDGYYYASAFKIMQRYLAHPDLLDNPPESVKEDVD